MQTPGCAPFFDDADSARPLSTFGDIHPADNASSFDTPNVRLMKPTKAVESTMIPGVTWGELLARDGRATTPFCITYTGEHDEPLTNPVLSMSIDAHPSTAERLPYTAANYLYRSVKRIHPLGKESKFTDSLRGGGTGLTSNFRCSSRRRAPAPKSSGWDSSYSSIPNGAFDPSLKRTCLQQQLYQKSRIARRSFSVEPAVGICGGWENPGLASVQTWGM